ncbi:uroporphyrinogen-III synthase [Brevundimonas sp.]|uniref:uroporphyrinogen-III synthase n=1 Tax=Brevundimonas sp. TaxID=1871086 RepID=UPI0035B04F75
MSDPGPAPQVWVTRTRPGADATADRLTDLGFRPLVSPLLTVVPLRPRLDLETVGALAFTSPNAVVAFARLAEGDAWRRLPAYAVGDATAEAIRDHGVADVRSASGDLDDLAALIAARPPSGEVLVVGPREPSGDLPALLRPRGVTARAVAVHATVAAPADEGRRALIDSALAAVLIHSAKAAAILADTSDSTPRVWPFVVAISEAAARPLADVAPRIQIAARPDESRLLAALTQALGKPRPRV